MNGGSAHEQAPASSGTNSGAAATFINLISLLLGSASDADQDVDAGSEDAPAYAEPKKDASQANSNSGSNGILISLPPAPNCAPAAPTAGATKGDAKAESTEGTAKRGESDSNKKRCDPEQSAANSLLAMNVVPGATPAPAPPSPPEPVTISSTPAVAQTASAVSGNGAIPLAHAGFASAPAAAPNKNEPPIAFVLQLKPNEQPNAPQSAPAQKAPPTAAEPLPAVATGVNTNGKAAAADTAEPKAAAEIKGDTAPAVSKAGLESGNHREESNGQDGTKQSPDHERQRDTQLGAGSEPARVDAQFKPDLAPVGVNQPHAQTESIQDSPHGTEPISRPVGVISSPEQPKAGPVREISFQSSSPDAGAVKVQVIDRGGDVRISVRSADPNLTHALQRDVGQLVTKLDHSGYEAKAWNPRETTSLAGITESRDVQIRPETGSNSNSGSDSGSRGGQGGAQDQSQQQRRHGDARQWTNTLDDSVRRTITEDEEDLWQA